MKQQARDSDSFDAHIHDTVPAGMSDDAVWHLVHENLDIRRQHSGMSEVTPTKSKKNLPPPSLPEEAQVKMTAIEIAQSLEMFGFYMPGQDGEETILPALPPSLKADITMAFAHYATDMGGESHDFAISPSDALPAMMYAGLFHSAQVYDVEQQPTTPLSEETFVGLCHRALMTPLTSSQVKTARDLFGIPDDESASYALSASGLQRSLRKILVGVSAEMADAYFIAFHRSGDVSDNLDINAVLGIMALLVRLHAPYCELLRACREILGLEKCDSSLDVECSRIVRASLQGGDPIAEEDAEEMLWSADWRLCGSGEGQRLGFPEMVSAITATFNREAGPLPPSQSQAEQEVLEEAEIFASPSAMELGTDKNWEALVADISRKHLPPASVSSKNLTDAFGKGVELSPPPHVPTGHDYGGEPDQKVRMQSGETSMSEVHISTQEKLKEAAVSFLIVLSTAALVLEPVISGKEDEQTQAEEQVWGIVELLITAFLTVEALTRFIILAKLGFEGSGQSTATLVVEVLATLPLYMEWVARASVLKEPLGGMLHDGLVDGAELFRVVRFARVSRFAAKTTLAAPVATMLVVVWGVYVKHGFSGNVIVLSAHACWAQPRCAQGSERCTWRDAQCSARIVALQLLDRLTIASAVTLMELNGPLKALVPCETFVRPQRPGSPLSVTVSADFMTSLDQLINCGHSGNSRHGRRDTSFQSRPVVLNDSSMQSQEAMKRLKSCLDAPQFSGQRCSPAPISPEKSQRRSVCRGRRVKIKRHNMEASKGSAKQTRHGNPHMASRQ
eukprot:6457310-Amphidinium_carterae.1